MPTATLASLADLRTRLALGPVPGGANSTAEQRAQANARLQDVLLIATADVEAFCRREFARKARKQRFVLQDSGRIDLDRFGSSETGLTYQVGQQSFRLTGCPVDTAEDFEVLRTFSGREADAEPLDAGLWELDEDTGRLTVRVSRGTLIVRYTGGYPVTDGVVEAPDRVRLATLLQAVFLYYKTNANNIGLVADRAVSDTGKRELTPFEREFLASPPVAATDMPGGLLRRVFWRWAPWFGRFA